MLVFYFTCFLLGYLPGSIPFGLLAARLKGVDIRAHGSGNIGATNVWRVCGWKFGLPVFLLDALKGVTAVKLADLMFTDATATHHALGQVIAAMGCILGHSFPVWLKFKGGKGVATALGVLLALMWKPGLAAFGVWLAAFAISRYVSLASIVAAAALPVAAWLLGVRGPHLVFAIIAAALVIARHRTNITRLLNGTESRFGKKKEVQP